MMCRLNLARCLALFVASLLSGCNEETDKAESIPLKKLNVFSVVKDTCFTSAKLNTTKSGVDAFIDSHAQVIQDQITTGTNRLSLDGVDMVVSPSLFSYDTTGVSYTYKETITPVIADEDSNAYLARGRGATSISSGVTVYVETRLANFRGSNASLTFDYIVLCQSPSETYRFQENPLSSGSSEYFDEATDSAGNTYSLTTTPKGLGQLVEFCENQNCVEQEVDPRENQAISEAARRGIHFDEENLVSQKIIDLMTDAGRQFP